MKKNALVVALVFFQSHVLLAEQTTTISEKPVTAMTVSELSFRFNAKDCDELLSRKEFTFSKVTLERPVIRGHRTIHGYLLLSQNNSQPHRTRNNLYVFVTHHKTDHLGDQSGITAVLSISRPSNLPGTESVRVIEKDEAYSACKEGISSLGASSLVVLGLN